MSAGRPFEGASQSLPVGRKHPKPTAYLRAFGRFWWEFLVGDTPELLLATLLVVGLAEALHHDQAIAIVAVLVAAVACLGLSTWRGRMKSVEKD